MKRSALGKKQPRVLTESFPKGALQGGGGGEKGKKDSLSSERGNQGTFRKRAQKKATVAKIHVTTRGNPILDEEKAGRKKARKNGESFQGKKGGGSNSDQWGSSSEMNVETGKIGGGLQECRRGKLK